MESSDNQDNLSEFSAQILRVLNTFQHHTALEVESIIKRWDSTQTMKILTPSDQVVGELTKLENEGLVSSRKTWRAGPSFTPEYILTDRGNSRKSKFSGAKRNRVNFEE